MKKLVVVLVVLVLLFALSAPAFAFGVPGAHGIDGRTFGGAVSLTVRGENPDFSRCDFVFHVSTWKPGLN